MKPVKAKQVAKKAGGRGREQEGRNDSFGVQSKARKDSRFSRNMGLTGLGSRHDCTHRPPGVFRGDPLSHVLRAELLAQRL